MPTGRCLSVWPSSVITITLEHLLRYHRRTFLDLGQPEAPLLSRDRLESVIARQEATAFGEELYPTLPEKAAALLHGITTGHPFMDGNKRAGIGAAMLLLELNGVVVDAPIDALYDLTLAVATGELREVEEIAARIRTLFALD